MNLVRMVNETAKEDASNDHIKEEKDYFEYGIKCLKGLIEFVEKESSEADDASRKKDYKQIATMSRVLYKELEKHITRYK